MIRFQRLFGRSIWQSTKLRSQKRNPRSFQVPSHRSTASEVESLEERLVLSPGIFALGSDAGIVTQVTVFDSVNGVPIFTFNPYSDIPGGFAGGVRTAVGYIRDINGDSAFPVVITAPGPGLVVFNPVRVFAGLSGQLQGGRFVNAGEALATLNPYPGFGGGIYVGAADFDLDGVTEVITGAGEGGGPHVRIQSLANFAVLFNAFVYNPAFLGGVRVAAGQLDPFNDPFPELITAAGPGGGPHVRVFSGFNGLPFPGASGSFFAYDPRFTGGVYISSADFTGDGRAEIVTGAGAGGGPHVRVIDPFSPDPNNPIFDISSFFAFEPTFTGGVRVAAGYLGPTNTDFIADLILARGFGGNEVIALDGATGAILYQGPAIPNFFGGSFPSTGKLQSFGEALRLYADDDLPGEAATQITTAQVTPLMEAALARLEEAGVSESLLDELASLEIRITNFSGDLLGLASPGVIILDDDAAGFGWYIDPTPTEDEEFGQDGGAIDPNAEGQVDLFTALLHELGHQLGLQDVDPVTNPHHLMAGTLSLGERRLPNPDAIDILFSGDTLLDHLLAPSLF